MVTNETTNIKLSPERKKTSAPESLLKWKYLKLKNITVPESLKRTENMNLYLFLQKRYYQNDTTMGESSVPCFQLCIWSPRYSEHHYHLNLKFPIYPFRSTSRTDNISVNFLSRALSTCGIYCCGHSALGLASQRERFPAESNTNTFLTLQSLQHVLSLAKWFMMRPYICPKWGFSGKLFANSEAFHKELPICVPIKNIYQFETLRASNLSILTSCSICLSTHSRECLMGYVSNEQIVLFFRKDRSLEVVLYTLIFSSPKEALRF